jgi:hypothetical protein
MRHSHQRRLARADFSQRLKKDDRQTKATSCKQKVHAKTRADTLPKNTVQTGHDFRQRTKQLETLTAAFCRAP